MSMALHLKCSSEKYPYQPTEGIFALDPPPPLKFPYQGVLVTPSHPLEFP